MGIINQGILGGFSGKVGPIVGFRWKSNYYIRARAAKVSNPRTPKQQEQRGKFATAFSFLKAIKTLSYVLATRNLHRINPPSAPLCPTL